MFSPSTESAQITYTIIAGLIAWLATSGVVQGVIIGATVAFFTAILILDAVASVGDHEI